MVSTVSPIIRTRAPYIIIIIVPGVRIDDMQYNNWYKMYRRVILLFLAHTVLASIIRSITFAKVEGIHRRLCLKNSSNVSGTYVFASDSAQ